MIARPAADKVCLPLRNEFEFAIAANMERYEIAGFEEIGQKRFTIETAAEIELVPIAEWCDPVRVNPMLMHRYLATFHVRSVLNFMTLSSSTLHF